MILNDNKQENSKVRKQLLLSVICGSIISLGAVTSADAALVTYTDQTIFTAAINGGTTLNFDTDANGNAIATDTIIDQQYITLGADFNPFANGTPTSSSPGTTAYGSVVPPVSGSNILHTRGISYGDGGFEVVFTNSVSGVGLYIGGLQDASYGITTLEIFDTSNLLIGSYDLANEIGTAAAGNLFFGVTSSTAISKLQINIGNSDFVWFDDLQYSQSISAVPVPAGFWLFGSGLIALFSAVKRKNT